MPIIAVSTNKGGVLKTSITTNLAGALCEKHKVLIIDTDNQGNVLVSFGVNPDNVELTLYDVLVDGIDPAKALINVHSNIDVLPANDDMSFLEFDVLSDRENYPDPFRMLEKSMQTLESRYDYILIDSPPNLGLVQGNVLSYADSVLVPFQPEGYSMRSLIKILNAIQNFKEKHNPKLNILGVVATLVDQRTTLHSEVLQQCRRYCLENDIRMFETVIPRSVRFAASVAYERKPATLTDSKNPLVQAYFDLLKEIEE
ncbi:ParA family protein [Bacillus sp. BRMEA1]|uniref:ParA family protein n=1 Tax=Neobacillus endophyticus TaxID=2738405 RepID=UPI001564D600|nr:ParA family protein [Neobacillus endophyticus]NRD81135.1 ParA family protein [Neobacillus endophyticus]